MNLKPINPDKKLKHTCIKNQSFSIDITESANKYYVKIKLKALNDLEIVTIHTTEEDAYQRIVSYLLGYTLQKTEKMNILQLKKMVKYLLTI